MPARRARPCTLNNPKEGASQGEPDVLEQRYGLIEIESIIQVDE